MSLSCWKVSPPESEKYHQVCLCRFGFLVSSTRLAYSGQAKQVRDYVTPDVNLTQQQWPVTCRSSSMPPSASSSSCEEEEEGELERTMTWNLGFRASERPRTSSTRRRRRLDEEEEEEEEEEAFWDAAGTAWAWTGAGAGAGGGG